MLGLNSTFSLLNFKINYIGFSLTNVAAIYKNIWLFEHYFENFLILTMADTGKQNLQSCVSFVLNMMDLICEKYMMNSKTKHNESSNIRVEVDNIYTSSGIKMTETPGKVLLKVKRAKGE